MNNYYLALSVVCVILLFMIMYKMFINSNRIDCYRPYMRVLQLSTLLGIFNVMDFFISGKDFNIGKSFHYVLNSITLIVVAMIFYQWFIYSEKINDSKLVKTRKRRILLGIPVMILVLASIIFFNKNGVIQITDDLHYIPGKYYFIFMFIANFYCGYTLISSKIRSMDKNKLNLKNKNKTINAFCIILLTSIFFSKIFLGKPHTMIGVALGHVYTYLCFLEQLITIDPLTSLNNRGQLINVLTNEIKNYSNDKDLYLLMMDMDYFKKINDTYGHVEGDNALITVSDILKKVCLENNYFVARYGGDEFNIIMKDVSIDDVLKLCNDIEEQLNIYNLNSNKSYKLLMSIGYKKYDNKIKNVTNFISEADKVLYKVKKERKSKLA